jgi:two-component system response regulator RegA
MRRQDLSYDGPLGGHRNEEDPLTATTPLIYIADDSSVVRSVVAQRLADAGLRVHAGGSAADSRNVTIRGFACALLDLDLGDGNGVDVAELLRVHQPELPVAFFSGGAAPTVVARARAMGPVFRKPDELEAAITWVVRCAKT